MKDKRKAYEEKFDTQLQSWKDLKTGAEKVWDEVMTVRPSRLKIQMSKTISRAANSHARSLAEAVILQSIEDLWNPVYKRGSLLFFKGDGFGLCSEIAGISYIKQLAMLKMLSNAGTIINLRNMRKTL